MKETQIEYTPRQIKLLNHALLEQVLKLENNTKRTDNQNQRLRDLYELLELFRIVY